jgi:alpha-mannosidase
MKRFNRLNQRLADAAERAAVTADWLGGLVYPRETLREAFDNLFTRQ